MIFLYFCILLPYLKTTSLLGPIPWLFVCLFKSGGWVEFAMGNTVDWCNSLLKNLSAALEEECFSPGPCCFPLYDQPHPHWHCSAGMQKRKDRVWSMRNLCRQFAHHLWLSRGVERHQCRNTQGEFLRLILQLKHAEFATDSTSFKHVSVYAAVAVSIFSPLSLSILVYRWTERLKLTAFFSSLWWTC